MKNLFVALARYLQETEPWIEAAQAVHETGEPERSPTTLASVSAPPIALDLVGLVGNHETESILHEFRSVASDLLWRQNPTYTDDVFLSRYAYSELIGPQGPVTDKRLSVGLLYLAPHTTYPPHAHPAEESYHLLAGESEWHAGEGSITANSVRQPGDRIEHPSWISHTMRTGSTPMLALYIWRGNLDVPARLTQDN